MNNRSTTDTLSPERILSRIVTSDAYLCGMLFAETRIPFSVRNAVISYEYKMFILPLLRLWRRISA